MAVTVVAGTGRLLRLPAPAASLLAADPRIARVQPASPTSVFLMGVAPGRTTVIATDQNGSAIVEWNVTVQPGTGVLAPTEQSAAGSSEASSKSPRAIEIAIRRNLSGMDGVRVSAVGPNLLELEGWVANARAAEQAEAAARAFAGGREVVNDLKLLSSIQVNVRVRVAEISRQITRELGFNWQALGKFGSFLLGIRTGTGVAGGVIGALASATPTGASRFAAGVATNTLDLNSVIDALAGDNLIKILAEPNLTAMSGETASFLAGGEFPIPVSGSTGGGATQISVEWKEYGVALSFVPTVLSPDQLNLRIRPEVSQLTNQGAVSLPLATGTITIPALTVRRAETTVELGSGQSFAIAGLLLRTSTQTDTGPIGLGDVPVLGTLFRSDSFQRGDSELVIIVTPYLVRPVSNPHELAAPTDGFRPATDLDRILYQRQIAGGHPPLHLQSHPDAGFILE